MTVTTALTVHGVLVGRERRELGHKAFDLCPVVVLNRHTDRSATLEPPIRSKALAVCLALALLAIAFALALFTWVWIPIIVCTWMLASSQGNTLDKSSKALWPKGIGVLFRTYQRN